MQQRLVLVILSILSIHAFLINIDAQDAQDDFRKRLACIPEHPQIGVYADLRAESASLCSSVSDRIFSVCPNGWLAFLSKSLIPH